MRCHAIGPGGGVIGPNLVSLGGSSTPEYILQSLIDPNAKLKEGFQTLTVLTDDGRVVSGLQKSRTDTQLQLLLADGTLQTIATEAIDTVQNGRSLMPTGLVDILKERDLIDRSSRDSGYRARDPGQPPTGRLAAWLVQQMPLPVRHH